MMATAPVRISADNAILGDNDWIMRNARCLAPKNSATSGACAERAQNLAVRDACACQADGRTRAEPLHVHKIAGRLTAPVFRTFSLSSPPLPACPPARQTCWPALQPSCWLQLHALQVRH